MSTRVFQQISDTMLERLSRASHAKMYPSPDPFTKGKTETPLRKLLLVSSLYQFTSHSPPEPHLPTHRLPPPPLSPSFSHRLWNAVRRHQSYRAWSTPPLLSPPAIPQQLSQPEEIPSADAMPQDLDYMLQTTNGFEDNVAEQDPGFYIPPPIVQAPVVGQEGVFSLHSISSPSSSDSGMEDSVLTHSHSSAQPSGPEILFIQEYPGQEDYYHHPQNAPAKMPADEMQQPVTLVPSTPHQLFNVATMTASGDGMTTTTTSAAMLSQPGLGLIAAVPLGTSPPTPTTLLDHSQIVFQIPVDNSQQGSSMSSSLSNYNNTGVLQSAVPAAKQKKEVEAVDEAVKDHSKPPEDVEAVENIDDSGIESLAQDDDVENRLTKKRSVDDLEDHAKSEKPTKRSSPTKDKDINNRNIISSYSLRSRRKSGGPPSPTKQQSRGASFSLASQPDTLQEVTTTTTTTGSLAGTDGAKRIERGIERLSLEPEPHIDNGNDDDDDGDGDGDDDYFTADLTFAQDDDYATSSHRKRKIDEVDDHAVPEKSAKNPSHDIHPDDATSTAAGAGAARTYSLRSRNRVSPPSPPAAAPPAKQTRNVDFVADISSPPTPPALHITTPTIHRKPSSPLATEESALPRAVDPSPCREHTPRRNTAPPSTTRRNPDGSSAGSATGSAAGSPPSPGPASPGPVLISA
ncbi:hypothetical protein BC936DRAFT_148957 [Jimgerdemannia flammicorona]|uniref:Uncharacterized protein n=1 Tax=Jimgerdemannia flammicorona TaxID=994334 RepID=A0A433D1X9_9FUNG|nr:hypothetical protein BC936DRAFT_148957 [Jimgerdemannia flammicorona]